MHPTIQASRTNHQSNEESMLSYIDNVIAPFVDRVREDLVNKAAESFLTSEFQNWYGDQVTQQYNATAHDEEVEGIR